MKLRCILLILLFTISAAGCIRNRDQENIKSAANTVDEDKAITSVKYNKDGIEGEYPKLIAGGTQEELDSWNRLIYDDFDKILQIYSFNPFPELPNNKIPTILKIKYEVKLNSKNFISIMYTASYNSPYSAHPTQLVYTTNIDKGNNKRLQLSDIIEINEDFIKNFRTWERVNVEGNTEEINKAIQDYMADLYMEDLLLGFKSADIIGYGNLWGIYSYLTPDSLGISVGVPNYIGDHVEFERKYTQIEEFLKLKIK